MKKTIFKHVLMLLTALALTCAAASCNSFGSTEYAIISQNNISADGFVYDKYENSTVRITGMENTPAVLVIPEKIDGMTVVEIADKAFAENDKIFYVKLPATAIKLGAQTFSGCPALLTIDFSNSVAVIPENTFEGCINLVSVENADSVTEIAAQAFADCTSLTKFSLPASLTKIGAEAFRGCASLTSIVIPEAVTEIEESAFWGCTSLVSVEIKGKTSLPAYCFLNCTALTRVVLGDSVNAIGEEAFRGCRALYTVELGSGLCEIGDYAFHACDELTEVRFPAKSNIKIGEGNDTLGVQG